MDEDYFVRDDGTILWEQGLISYSKYLKLLVTNNMQDYLPITSNVYIKEKRIIVHVFENYKLVPITLDYLQSVKNIDCIQLNPDTIHLMQDVTGKLVLAPWTIIYASFDKEDLNESYDGTYWLSIYTKKPIIGVREIDLDMPKLPKTMLINESTNVAKQVQLSKFSHERFQTYLPLEYVFQSGDNQIWMSDKHVIKMCVSKPFYLHEISILKLGLPCFPKLIDYWEHKDGDWEYFIVMENEGKTLGSIYYVDALIPTDIKDIINKLHNELKSYGFEALDPHLLNIVVKKDKYTMIDMEHICWIEDKKAIENKIKDYQPKCNIQVFRRIKFLLDGI